MPASKKILLAAVAAAALMAPLSAQARNIEVETSLRSLGDVSDFYHALIYTGVANELREGQSYTILAPTNHAFAVLNRENYPCFYQPQCHDLAAAFVRAHIIEGRYPEKGLVRQVRLETIGQQWVHAEEPYVNQYSVNDQQILSEAEVGNSIIYRVDGMMVAPQNLTVFQAVAYPVPDTVTTRTTTTYIEPASETEVNSQPVIVPGVNADSTTIQKTTVTRTYVPGQAW